MCHFTSGLNSVWPVSEGLGLLSCSVLVYESLVQALGWTHGSLAQSEVPGRPHWKGSPEGFTLLVLESPESHLGPQHLNG